MYAFPQTDPNFIVANSRPLMQNPDPLGRYFAMLCIHMSWGLSLKLTCHDQKFHWNIIFIMMITMLI